MAQRARENSKATAWGFGARFLPLAIILLFFALSLHQLEAKSLWFDEMGTLTGAGWGGSWLDAIRKPLTIPTTPKPPLSFLVTRVFLALGDRVFLLRLPAVFFATLSISLTFSLGKAMFETRVGLMGALLLAIAPLHIRYAQEARMYAMLTFLLTLTLYLFWRAIHSRQRSWWIGFAAAAALALYTHLFALLGLAALVLFALWLTAAPQNRGSFANQWRRFGPALVAIAIAYAPMIPFAFRGITSGEGLGGEPARGWDLAAVVSAARLFSTGSPAGMLLYVGLALLALGALARKGRQVWVLAALWLFLPPGLVLLLPFGHLVLIRYFLFGLPLYLLLVAYGLLAVLGWVSRQFSRHVSLTTRSLSVMALLVVLSLVILAVLNIPSLTAYYAETKQEWREAARLVSSIAEPGDQILVRHEYHQAGLLFYLKQSPQGADPWSKANVRILPRDVRSAFPADGQGASWLVVPYRDNYLPGGAVEALIQPDYELLAPIVLRPDEVPVEAGILAPTSYRTLSIIPAIRAGQPSVRFWSEADTIDRGQCTWLYWAVDNVQEIYLEGQGIVGRGEAQVCPTATTEYVLEAILADGSRESSTIRVTVTSQ